VLIQGHVCTNTPNTLITSPPPSRHNRDNNTAHRNTPKRNIPLFLSLSLSASLCLMLNPASQGRRRRVSHCRARTKRTTVRAPLSSAGLTIYDTIKKEKEESHGKYHAHTYYSVSQTPPTPTYLPAPTYLKYEPPPQKRENPSLENKNPLRWHACSKQAATEIRSKNAVQT
jgi:hypothetical protein